MTRARDLADSADKDIVGTLNVDGLTVENGVARIRSTSDPDSTIEGLQLTASASATGKFLPAISWGYGTSAPDFSLIEASRGTGIGGRLYFKTANASGTMEERLFINEDGKFGIGTSSPKTNLDLSSATGPQITLTRSQGTNIAGDTLGRLNFYNKDFSGDGENNAAIIEAVASTATGAAADLLFRTKSTGVDGADAEEAMRISRDGNVGIGTSSPSSMKLLVHENSDKEATIKVENYSATANAVAALRLESTGNNFAILNYPDAGTEDNTTRFISTAGGSSFKFATGAVDRMAIQSNGRVDLNGPDYTYGAADSNYHIKLEENTHHAYISNINGTMFLASGGRYFGGNLRSLDASETSYAGISVSIDVGVSVYGSTGHNAGQVDAPTLLHHRLETTTGAAIFNDTGASTGDFRVESDSKGSMFFVDASQNTVNINNSAAYASNTFLVNQTSDARGIALAHTARGNSRVEFQLSGVNNEGANFYHNNHTDRKQLFHMSRTNVVVNEEGLDMDFRVESDSSAHALFVDAGKSTVSLGSSYATPSAPSSGVVLDVYQSGVHDVAITRSFTVNSSSTTNVVLDLGTDLGIGGKFNFHIEIDVGGYGNSSSGPILYKWVGGGYSTTAGSMNSSVLANSCTNGSVAVTRTNTDKYNVAITNTHGSHGKFGVVRFRVLYA